MIRWMLTACVLLLPMTTLSQETYVVPASSALAWDYDVSADYVSEFGIYLSRTAGIVPDGSPDFRVAWPGPSPIDPAALYWTIDASVQPGRWHAVVTAFGTDSPQTESAPSNEVNFVIMGAPGNLTVVKEE